VIEPQTNCPYKPCDSARSVNFCTRYRTGGVGKRVRSTSLYHSRQCGIVLESCSDLIDCTVVCFMVHDCSRK